MAHTYTSLHAHLVFSTSGRRNLIPQDLLPEVHAYMGGIVRKLGGRALAVGGTTNHVHLLVGLPPTLAPAPTVSKIKANLTGWAHKTHAVMSEFAWQEGYGAFSVSRSRIEDVVEYIADQIKHHGAQSFEEEYVALLERHGIDYDPRYLWG